jgi:hypothetical protein
MEISPKWRYDIRMEPKKALKDTVGPSIECWDIYECAMACLNGESVV